MEVFIEMFRHNFAVSNYDEMEEELTFLIKNSIYNESDIAIMPDAHRGKAHASVGFTATYDNKIIPNTCGVDLCCRVTLFRIDGEIDLDILDKAIHEHVPSGNSIRQNEPIESQQFPYEELRCWDAIKDGEERYRKSMGTLGGGKMCDCLRAA